MPANGSSKSAPAAKTPGTGSFMNDYLADWDDENPFRSPSPEPAKNDKKDVLGIEKELDLKKKPRAPRVKLDDTRLLSEKGIPKLRKMAPKLKLKGKGHEFSDAARLLTFYQEWLDDLFPKATFLDALTMVEKAGHKTALRNARMKWIDEGRPKGASVVEDGGDPFGEDNRIYQTERRKGDEGLAEVFEKAAAAAAERERAKTPTRDLFGDEDIYDATPRRNVGSGGAPAGQGDDGVPDEDDLDALMAEAGAGPGSTQQKAAEPPVRSIFGNGMSSRVVQPTGEPDEDDLDALMAEAEAEAAQSSSNGPPAKKSIFGDGMGKAQAAQGGFDEDDDLDALMAEAEAEAVAAQAGKYKEAVGSKPQPAGQTGEYGDDDDLDALMAEAEAEANAAAKSSGAGTEGPPKQADKAQEDVSFEAEEEVMAEMEGLW